MVATVEKAPDSVTLLLESSERLSLGTSLHHFVFQKGRKHNAMPIPSQYITLQLPPDLDPIGGSKSLDASSRRISLTPCALRGDRLSILAKNGRVTGLLGSPRPHRPLVAALIAIDGGFPTTVLTNRASFYCIAGGTGIACFTAMASMRTNSGPDHLIWSLREEELHLLQALVKYRFIEPLSWVSVTIFITNGGAESEMSPPQIAARTGGLSKYDNVTILRRRMQSSDLKRVGSGTTILYCGGKALEWQVRYWMLDTAEVLTTRSMT